MNDKQQRQLKRLEEAVDKAYEPCEQAGIDLIYTEPATLAGIVATIRYIQIHARNGGAFMPHRIVFEFERGSDGDDGKTLGGLDVLPSCRPGRADPAACERHGAAADVRRRPIQRTLILIDGRERLAEHGHPGIEDILKH